MIFKRLAELDCVEAIALGGSRAGKVYDEKSDYDVYVYVTAPIDEELRRRMLAGYCSYMEIGNHFWEYEDNCVLNSGIDIDILYRDLDDFCSGLERVVENGQPSNAYTTCMWHNLLHCRIICDKAGRLQAARERFDVPYPQKLKQANVLDYGFGMFRECLQYKLERQGKALITVSRFTPTAKTCHVCGAIDERPHEQDWVCPACGAAIVREVNSARNIRDAGLAG